MVVLSTLQISKNKRNHLDMKFTKIRKSALIGLSIIVSSAALTQTASAQPYWKDSGGDIVHNNKGECWRTINWSIETALPECDAGAAKAEVQAAPVVEKQAAVIIGDKDGDGVNDNNDQCPNTAAGTAVDSKGCDKDSDGDGIVDAQDDCPNTAKGKATNSRGCELKASLDLTNIQFETGTSKLNSSSLSDLDNIAAVLVKNSHMSFEIAGHTDNTGSHRGNVNLSQKRADSVRRYLINNGVSADRLTAKGYGPDKPVASNDTKAGRADNRRVELVLK